MPYLEDDPAIDYLDEPDPDAVPLGRDGKPLVPRPAAIAPPSLGAPPVAHPVGAGDQPTIREIIAQSQPQPPAVSPDQEEMNGAVSAVKDAQAKRAASLQDRPTTPEPKWWQRLAAGAAGAAAGYTNAAGRTHVDPSKAIAGIYGVPGQQRKMENWQKQYEGAQADTENAQQNLTTLQRIRAMQSTEDTAKVNREHIAAQTANLPGQSVTAAIEHGGEIVPDGQTAPEGREGSVQTIGGKQIFFPSRPQQKKDSEEAKQTNWMEVTPEMAAALKDIGVSEGDSVPPTVFNKYQQMVALKSKQPNLVHKEFTNENTGDVTMIGFDPATMQEKTRQVIKGVAVKRPPASVMVASSATPDMVDQEARKALVTGKPPASGRNPGLQTKILNRMAELVKEQGMDPTEVPALQAGFKANSDALNKLTTQRNQIGAFEKTAGKNLDVFMQQAKQITDSGSPLVNRVFRGGQRELAGDPKLAAFDAARVTAFTEISRVLSGAMATQLSDSARHEAESILRSDYTIPQLMAVAATLRRDMTNRMKSFDEQIGEVKQGMGGHGSAQPKAAEQPTSVKMRAPNGQINDVPADQVDHYKSLGAVVVGGK